MNIDWMPTKFALSIPTFLCLYAGMVTNIILLIVIGSIGVCYLMTPRYE
jgi:hypothetical protein